MRKSSVLLLSVLFLYTLAAGYIIYNNPLPFGKMALIPIGITFILVFIMKTGMSKKIFISVGLLASTFFLFSGFRSMAINASNEKNVFNMAFTVNFEKEDMISACQIAKERGKPIFVDFYTAWCKPCLQYSKEVLTDQKVGDAMNTTFINLKYNANKGEGIELAEKFNIYSFPTYLVLNDRGEIIERIETLNKEKTIALAQKYAK